VPFISILAVNGKTLPTELQAQPKKLRQQPEEGTVDCLGNK